MNIFIPLFASVFLLVLSFQVNAKTIIKHCIGGDNGYVQGLLELALKNTKEKYQLQRIPIICPDLRKIRMTMTGKIDIFWTGADSTLNKELIPVPVPIFKGIAGNRILLIKKGDQAKFSQIKSLKDLKNLRFGQGDAWVDTKILRESGLSVITTSHIKELYPMLAYRRFDAFPRSVLQAWSEAKKHEEYGIVMEENIAIYYNVPAFFYVSPHKKEFAENLEQALYKTVKNGDFDKYFYNHPFVKTSIKNTKLQKRRAFILENPFLPKWISFDRKELWVDLSLFE